MSKIITKRIIVASDLDVVTARLEVRGIARKMGFGTIDQARISLAASELARILARNIGEPGEIVVSGMDNEGHLGLQIVSVNPGVNGVSPEGDATNAISLVDEGFVDIADNQNVRITLMKWL